MRIISAFLFVAGFFALLAGCKKQSSEPGGTVPLLSVDPTVDNSYGQRINLSAWGGGSIAAWGRNSNELIANTPKGILLINLSSATAEKLTDNISGLVTQRDNSGNEIIFVGTVNNENGYYRLNLSTRAVTKILSLTKDQGSAVQIYNNYMFVYIGTSVLTGRPCQGLWDFWCGQSWTLTDTKFFHLNTTTGVSKPLDKFSFVSFSADGTKALLSDGNTTANSYKYYVFDNSMQKITDSVFIPFLRSGIGRFYWGAKLLYTAHQFSPEYDLIIDAFTDQEVRRFPSYNMLVQIDETVWSKDGTKLYQGTLCKPGDCKFAINQLTLATGDVKKLVSTTSSAYSAVPFAPILPSDDNTKLAFAVDGVWYLKSIQ